ncbi:hypothetical protein DFS33DRAFT_965445 [Desarmillaria ectypa]|nr:hypothetical protein DFS33DRAFT_965445 [Desarmillaria ectypa]
MRRISMFNLLDLFLASFFFDGHFRTWRASPCGSVALPALSFRSRSEKIAPKGPIDIVSVLRFSILPTFHGPFDGLYVNGGLQQKMSRCLFSASG